MALLQTMIEDNCPQWKALYKVVKESAVGDMFAWDSIKSIIGFDVRNDRNIIYTVNRQLIKENKNILVNVWMEGYKISCNDIQIIHAAGHKKKAGNQLKFCKTELGGLDIKNLTAEQKKDMVHLMNRVTSGLNVIEGKAISGLKKSKEAIARQEESLLAIKKMKEELAGLEAKLFS